MNLQEILNLEGIVIRKIPAFTVRKWRIYNPDVLKLYKKKGAKIYKDPDGVGIAELTRINAFGGKYLVTISQNTGPNVIFNIKFCGVGETIDQAYNDFIEKCKTHERQTENG